MTGHTWLCCSLDCMVLTCICCMLPLLIQPSFMWKSMCGIYVLEMHVLHLIDVCTYVHTYELLVVYTVHTVHAYYRIYSMDVQCTYVGVYVWDAFYKSFQFREC